MIVKQLLEAIKPNDFSLSNKVLHTKTTGVFTNSRLVLKNSIFVARKGASVDGHSFISKDLVNKAALIIVESERLKQYSNLYPGKIIGVSNSKLIATKLCSIFYYDLPTNIIMITGTNGKTSTSFFCSQLLLSLNLSNIRVGTLGVYEACVNTPEKKIDQLADLTTPEGADVFKILSEAKQKGINWALIEASSEGLAEGRIAGLKPNIAVFTNLTQDHLNYHGSMDSYYKAKAKLFLELLKTDGCAVINTDDSYGVKLYNDCKSHGLRVVDYGFKAKSLNIKKISHVLQSSGGYIVDYKLNEVLYQSTINLLGSFQVYNILASILVIFEQYINLQNNNQNHHMKLLCDEVARLKSPQGRAEIIANYKGGLVVIDYAHTPDSLMQIITSIRKVCLQRIILVVGCGGNRDKLKRPLIGSIAAKNADVVYITDDNPRDESPNLIRQQIIEGINQSNNSNKDFIYHNIGDRKQAIQAAVGDIKPGDFVLVVGKGHEKVQITGLNKMAFSDHQVVHSFIKSNGSQ